MRKRACEGKWQIDLLQTAWEESGRVYGYRKLHDDLLDHGETCCPNRVARLTRIAGIKAQIGYKRRPGIYGGRPSIVIDNTLDRQFDVAARDKAWVTDITYLRTNEGFGYLAVVIDLYSRRVIGWSMQSRQTTDIVLQALLMAVWRRKPKEKVLVHSDQGSEFTSMDWASFLKHRNLVHSISRRGNRHDNAVAESFFNLRKRERKCRKVYRSRDEARQDLFDYIEMFYNSKRKHVRNGMLSPVEFENTGKRNPRVSTKLGAIHLRLGSRIGTQLVGHNYAPCAALALDQLAHQTQRGRLVSSALQQGIKYVTVCIDGAPQLVFLTLDRHHHLIELPLVGKAATRTPTELLSEPQAGPLGDGLE